MKVFEEQIIVNAYKDYSRYFYTAQVRRIGFLWRSRWRTITPTHQPTMREAQVQIDAYIKSKQD